LHVYAPNEFHVCIQDDTMIYDMHEWGEDERDDIATSWAQNQVMWRSIQITSSLGENFLSIINMFEHP
jgi:hypothetical protein